MSKTRNTNPIDPVNGEYLRNLIAKDKFRVRIPKQIVDELELEKFSKVSIWINEKRQIVLEPEE